MVAVSDFSGLMSSAWALAKAEASAATVSLDRGMGRLRLKHIKAHRTRFRALCSHAVPDGLPGILRHQGFEHTLRPFVGIGISTHLPPPVMIESTEVLKWVTHMLCWTWAIYFAAAASSENDHGSMNLDSKTAPVASTVPSRVATIQGMAECLTRRWTSVTCRPVLRSYQERLSASVAAPSCTMRLPDMSSGSTSPRFSRQRRIRAASSLPMIIRASEPPMKARRVSPGVVHMVDFMTSSIAEYRV